MTKVVTSSDTRVRVAVHPPELPNGVIVFYDHQTNGRASLLVETEPRWVGRVRTVLRLRRAALKEQPR